MHGKICIFVDISSILARHALSIEVSQYAVIMALFYTQYVAKTYQHVLQSAGKMTKKKRVNANTVSPLNSTHNQGNAKAKNIATKPSTSKKAVAENTYSKKESVANTFDVKKDSTNKIDSSANKENNSTEKPQESAPKRNLAIDGLRALAIIGIVCFHMRPSMLTGGFLGVTLFLVLSGYFCTRTVLRYISAREKENSTDSNRGVHNYWQYVWHRIKRIWPPTLGIIGVTAPIMWLFSPSLLPKLQADAFSGAGFFSNIMYVARKLSYFEQSGLPSPIKHLWYLGLVMQAFIIWPLILTALIKFVRKAMVRMYITAGLAILSSALTFTFAYLFGNYTTPARVYYSLDTRASEFLLGAMLAMYCAWFSKHSLHAWLIHVWYFVRGKKNIIVELSKNKADNYENASNNAESQSSASSEISAEKNAYDDGIPEDLRAGLQIDLTEDAQDSSETSGKKPDASDIRELPENAFNTPKTVFYSPLKSWQRSAIGIAATIILCLCFVYADGTSSVFTFGGYTITAAACTLIVWSCTQSDNICSRIFALKPLAYLGKRSFAIYLVHFPLLELCNPATRTTAVSWWEQLLQLVATVVIAECFYQLFENKAKNHLHKLIHCVALTICCIITVALIVLPLNWRSIAEQRSIQLRPELSAATAQQNTQKKNSSSHKAGSSSTRKKIKGLRKNVTKQTLPPTPSKHRILFPIAEKVPRNLIASHTRIDKNTGTCSVNFTMVGDSITEGAKPYLLKVMPNAYIDGKVSRQIFHGADEYEQDISGKHAGDIVIYALGTNGPPHDDSVLQHMVDVVHGKPVYFVTTRVPQPWQDVTNDRLRKFAATHPNVGIIDWHGFSEGHSEYLTDDGVHLTPVGGPQYSKMIRLALCGA